MDVPSGWVVTGHRHLRLASQEIIIPSPPWDLIEGEDSVCVYSSGSEVRQSWNVIYKSTQALVA